MLENLTSRYFFFGHIQVLLNKNPSKYKITRFGVLIKNCNPYF